MSTGTLISPMWYVLQISKFDQLHDTVFTPATRHLPTWAAAPPASLGLRQERIAAVGLGADLGLEPGHDFMPSARPSP